MGIVAWPHGVHLGSHERCALCGRNANINHLAIGMVAAGAQPAFVCNGHFWDKTQFIYGWADYMVDQRFGPLEMSGS